MKMTTRTTSQLCRIGRVTSNKILRYVILSFLFLDMTCFSLGRWFFFFVVVMRLDLGFYLYIVLHSSCFHSHYQ